jgi:hypothetical protein
VRANLLSARLALSCCAMVSTSASRRANVTVAAVMAGRLVLCFAGLGVSGAGSKIRDFLLGLAEGYHPTARAWIDRDAIYSSLSMETLLDIVKWPYFAWGCFAKN